MRISIVAVGTRMQDWVAQAFLDYCRRLPAHIKIELTEIPVGGRSGRTEHDLLLSKSAGVDRIIALDQTGAPWSTLELSKKMQDWLQQYPQVAIMIGGPDGLSDQCRQQAHELWSLSNLTLPHGLVRVVLAEQLYRAWTVLQGHPYHRA